MSEAFASHGVESDVRTWEELAVGRVHLGKHGCDLFIFVKEWSLELARELRASGTARIAVDLLDNFALNATFDPDSQDYREVDVFVVASGFHRTVLASRFAPTQCKPIWVVPHHHSNLFGQVNNITRPVRCVGFQGDITNRLPRALEARLRAFCDNRGLDWVAFYTHETKALHPYMSPSEINAMVHHQLTTIDIGVIFPPEPSPSKENKSTPTLKYAHENVLLKPATRLLNFLSHGIPTVCFPYASYLEVCTRSGYALFCSDEDSLFARLDELASNESLRTITSEQGLAIAAEYSLARIAEHYLVQIEGYVNRGKK